MADDAVWGALSMLGSGVIVLGVLWLWRTQVRHGIFTFSPFRESIERSIIGDGPARKRDFVYALATMAAGVTLVVFSITQRDVDRSTPCDDACREAGWRWGEVRRSPHDPDARVEGCWCGRGADWSDAPIIPGAR